MKAIRIWLTIFIVGLVLSGATAFPLVTEVRLLADILHDIPAPEALRTFIDQVHEGLTTTATNYPFIAYGTDWLAFAHLVIALAFIDPWRDPVRNIWVIEWAMLCCIAIVPLALIAGPIRHLPWWWLPIDISFGAFGIIPLLIVHRLIKRLPRPIGGQQFDGRRPAGRIDLVGLAGHEKAGPARTVRACLLPLIFTG